MDRKPLRTYFDPYMCGNFSALKEKRLQKKLLEQGLDIDAQVAEALEDLRQGTLFPSMSGWILDRNRELRQALWGLVPAWSQDRTISCHTYNARSETMADKPAFRDAFREGRCLVPAQGWWEWDGRKRKTFVRPADASQLLFAGLWCQGTFTIVTKDSGPDLVELHHRQPVILDRESALGWIGPTTEKEALAIARESDFRPVLALEVEPSSRPQLDLDL